MLDKFCASKLRRWNLRDRGCHDPRPVLGVTQEDGIRESQQRNGQLKKTKVMERHDCPLSKNKGQMILVLGVVKF